jgi:hypothetical protein
MDINNDQDHVLYDTGHCILISGNNKAAILIMALALMRVKITGFL